MIKACRIVLGLIVFAGIISADVTINAGDNFQSKVDANSGNTTFIIKKGMHRLQQVRPKTGNTFIGEDGAVMSGARVLSNWQKSGNYWVHSGQTQRGRVSGNCRDNLEACKSPEDLYMDGEFLEEVDRQSDLKAGCWYFDYGADKVYMADDPSNHTMEISVKEAAFRGTAASVTIKNLTIERYATPVKDGAIMRDAAGSESQGNCNPGGWVIENCSIGYNHALAMKICGVDNVIIRNNKLHHNGQIGIVTVWGKNMRFEYNEVSDNYIPKLRIAMAEEGGTKFVRSDSAKIRYNWVHHNNTAGLWADIDNSAALYEGNLVEYNGHQGLFHEIGGSAIMRCNICRFNGIKWSAWLYGANILVSASSNVEVMNNIVEVGAEGDYDIGGNGICIVYQPELRPYECEDNYIHHNDITYWGERGLTGIGNDDKRDSTREAWWDNTTNKFDYNTYHTTNEKAALWNWKYWRDWADFRAQGQEEHGTLDSVLGPSATLHTFTECSAAAAVWDSLANIWGVTLRTSIRNARRDGYCVSYTNGMLSGNKPVAICDLRGRFVAGAAGRALLKSGKAAGVYIVQHAEGMSRRMFVNSKR
jgi:hypothetical protein